MIKEKVKELMTGKTVEIIYSEDMCQELFIGESIREKIFENPYGTLTKSYDETPFECEVDFKRVMFSTGSTRIKFRYVDVELVRINN